MIQDSYAFDTALDAMLELEADGKKCEIFSGNLEEIKIELSPYSFEVKVCFSAYDHDDLLSLLANPKILHATLITKLPDSDNVMIQLKGAKKSVEVKFHEKGLGLYEIVFIDYATKTWGEHITKNIYVDKTMKDVIEQEKNPLISIKYDWDQLNKSFPLLAYSLDKNVSFYSFLMWYCHLYNGLFEIDYKSQSYLIRGKKDADSEVIKVAEWDVTPALCKYPEPSRSTQRIIKLSADSLDQNDIENPHAIPSVREDIFDDAGNILFPDQFPQNTLSTKEPGETSIQFSMKKLPSDFSLDKLYPGTLFEILGDETRGGEWCDFSPIAGQTFRITNVSIRATRTTGPEESQRFVQPYNLEVSLIAESKDETYVQRPPFQSPVYPFNLPGMIVSEKGDKEQTTMNLMDNDHYPNGHYHVLVKLEKENKKVIIPFHPDMLSGQFYFPHRKEQKVDIAFYFQAAKIEKVIDLEPHARAPKEEQVNQIILGSNGQDNLTKIEHLFRDGKDSVLRVLLALANKLRVLEIEEKFMRLALEDKDKRLITIEFNSDGRLLLSVDDKESGIKQTSTYNAQAMTHVSEGKGKKSVIMQSPEEIFFDCPALKVKCGEANFDVEKTLTLKSGGNVFIEGSAVHLLQQVIMGS